MTARIGVGLARQSGFAFRLTNQGDLLDSIDGNLLDCSGRRNAGDRYRHTASVA